MKEEVFKAKVLNKEQCESGLIFKTTKYYVILQIESLQPSVHRRRLPLEDYYTYTIGEEFNLHMFSYDNKRWYFSEREASRY